ncbi:MAG: glycyl-radical enzyme activating protein [Thermodesulfobacteriota bacterium]
MTGHGYEQTGIVFNIMRFSTRDGPRLRTTVFLKGCPLGCLWCHNPESQSVHPEIVFRPNRCIGCGECELVCPQGAIVLIQGKFIKLEELCVRCGRCVESCPAEAREVIGRRMTVAQVMEEIKKDLPFFEESGGGVTFSGGEPLSQPEFLEALLKACKDEEIHTAVDTCGLADVGVLERIMPFVDLFLYDLKIMDDEAHQRETGASNRLILENLKKLDRTAKEVWIRLPVIPGLTDGQDNLSALARFVAALEKIRYIILLPYHETGLDKYRLLGRECRVAGTERPSQERLEEMVRLLEAHGLKASLGA